MFRCTTEVVVVPDHFLSADWRVLMPWGAPIGKGLGVTNIYGLRTLRAQFSDVLIGVDASSASPAKWRRRSKLATTQCS